MKEKKTAQVHLRIAPGMLREIDKIAMKENRTRQNAFETLLIEALEQRAKTKLFWSDELQKYITIPE